MSNRPEFYETLFAIWHAGLIGVPLNAKLHSKEFDYILSDAQARLCFASPELMASIGHLPGSGGRTGAGDRHQQPGLPCADG